MDSGLVSAVRRIDRDCRPLQKVPMFTLSAGITKAVFTTTLRFDIRSTALRPFDDDLHHDRAVALRPK